EGPRRTRQGPTVRRLPRARRRRASLPARGRALLRDLQGARGHPHDRPRLARPRGGAPHHRARAREVRERIPAPCGRTVNKTMRGAEPAPAPRISTRFPPLTSAAPSVPCPAVASCRCPPASPPSSYRSELASASASAAPEALPLAWPASAPPP